MAQTKGLKVKRSLLLKLWCKVQKVSLAETLVSRFIAHTLVIRLKRPLAQTLDLRLKRPLPQKLCKGQKGLCIYNPGFKVTKKPLG